MVNLDKEKCRISALIITKNEEKNIEKCLQSLGWVDEIVIIDSQSEDKTVEIARRYTDKVFSVQWQGFAKTKNIGIEKTSGEWILWIDADEEISFSLAEEMHNAINRVDVNGFYILRQSQFLGKWIKHCGWYPDYVLRLFRKNEGSFDESKQVHESIILNGKSAYLKSILFHRPYSGLKDYFNKVNRYTSLSADEMWDKNKRAKWYHFFVYPFVVFLKKYIFKLGILDGLEGFILCVLTVFYVFSKYTKLWWKEKENETDRN